MVLEQGNNVVDSLNSILPDDIIVYDYLRTGRAFHPLSNCDSRVYEYCLPSYVFEPSFNKTFEQKENYKIPQHHLDKIESILKIYKGQHNFHNYTVQRSFSEASCNRFIYSFERTESIFLENTEWIVLRIHGNSFMLNQIRKMICFVILTIVFDLELKKIEESFCEKKMNIPLVPAPFLYLAEPVFSAYNKKLEYTDSDLKHITFEPYKATIKNFFKTKILPEISSLEKKERLWEKFFTNINEFKEQHEFIQ